jgi:2-oxoglutarate ferredoxin oxidoreductase subunit beta
MRQLLDARDKQEFITGLIYINESRPTFPKVHDLPETPLALLPEESLRPSREALDKIMASMF